jgi:hypothetical protein
MSDADRLYEHLAATAELPVERTASRLLGEAEAVADDLRTADPDVQAERAAVVLELLEKVEGTGSDEADEHVEEARRLAAELAEE